jgi:hypothetical protein
MAWDAIRPHLAPLARDGTADASGVVAPPASDSAVCEESARVEISGSDLLGAHTEYARGLRKARIALAVDRARVADAELAEVVTSPAPYAFIVAQGADVPTADG